MDATSLWPDCVVANQRSDTMSEDLIRTLRQARASMLGTDDEDTFWACHDAADRIESYENAGDPDAYAVVMSCGRVYDVYTIQEEAEAIAESDAVDETARVLPLYRGSPPRISLDDDEIEAINVASEELSGMGFVWVPDTLDGISERAVQPNRLYDVVLTACRLLEGVPTGTPAYEASSLLRRAIGFGD